MTDVSESTDATTPTTPRTAGRGRRILAWFLIVLATFLTFGVAAETWVKQQLLSTPRWVKMSDQILAQPQVQASLATYIVDEIYANVDVKSALADQLPDNFKGIAGPVSGALRGPATTAVEKVLASSQVKTIWHDVNTAAHKTLVNVLENKMATGSSKDGKVVLDVGEIVRIVAQEMGLPQGIVDKIPADVGQITIFQSDQLALVQRSVAILRIMGPILIAIVLALYALAVFVNRGRRIRTLRNVGWSVVFVGAAIVITRKLLGNYVVSMIPTSQYVPTGGLVFAIVTELLRQIGWLLIGWGALIVVGMLFVGPSRPARAIRRFLAPAINADAPVFWIGAGVLYVIAVLIFTTPALQVWWSVLLVAAIGAGYLEVVRRRTRVEFPETGLHVDGMEARVAALWGGITGWVRGAASKVTDHGDGSGSNSSSDPVERLARLAALHGAGALSDEEFAAAKAKLLE